MSAATVSAVCDCCRGSDGRAFAANRENEWTEYTAALSNDEEIVMRFGLQASDSLEEVWADYFRILGSGPDRAMQFCAAGGCPQGTFRGAGASQCAPCAPGSASADGAACTQCEPGTYSQRPGAATCTDCPAQPGGDVTSPAGATSPSQCVVQKIVIGYTSFEEPEPACHVTSSYVTTCSVQPYLDVLPQSSDHWLLSRSGANPVTYVACSAIPDGSVQAELGFKTYYMNTGVEGGLADGAKIGVIGDTSTPQRGDSNQGGPAPHGEQYYMLEDTGGFVFVSMDAVAVGDYSSVQMSGWAHLESATWEDTDHVKMWATDDTSGTEVVLLEGTNIDVPAGVSTGNVTQNAWKEYTAALDGFTSAVMRFGVLSDSASKETWWDYMRIEGLGPDRSSLFCGGGDVGGCRAGQFRGAGMTACQQCGIGETSADGAASCQLCPAGTYGAVPGACTPCPSLPTASTTSPEGSTSRRDCVSAPRVIGFSSFEEATITGGSSVPTYTDPLSGTDTDHWLVSVEGHNPVSYIPCSGPEQRREIGFRMHYFNSDASKFLGDAKIGVIGDASTEMRGDTNQGGPAPDGTQYLMLENTNEGFVRVELDPVHVADYTSVTMSGWVHVESTIWEAEDRMMIWASDSVNAELETVLIDAHDLDDAANITENAWREYKSPLGDGYQVVTMNFGLQTDSSFGKIVILSRFACCPSR